MENALSAHAVATLKVPGHVLRKITEVDEKLDAHRDIVENLLIERTAELTKRFPHLFGNRQR